MGAGRKTISLSRALLLYIVCRDYFVNLHKEFEDKNSQNNSENKKFDPER